MYLVINTKVYRDEHSRDLVVTNEEAEQIRKATLKEASEIILSGLGEDPWLQKYLLKGYSKVTIHKREEVNPPQLEAGLLVYIAKTAPSRNDVDLIMYVIYSKKEEHQV